MAIPVRHVVIGAGLGLLVGGPAMMLYPSIDFSALAATPSAFVRQVAQETQLFEPPVLDTTQFVRFGDRDYEITYDGSVSLDPLSHSVVRKIAFGVETQVSVVTTATGTYSSEGLVNPHFRYPGISVRLMPLSPVEATPLAVDDSYGYGFLVVPDVTTPRSGAIINVAYPGDFCTTQRAGIVCV